MKRLMAWQPWLTTLARLILAAVWFTAGWPKFTDTEGTIRSVRAFQLLPEALVRPFGYGLPLLELILGVLLVIGLGTRVAAILTGALMIMFLFGISWAWAQGLSINCGCFGNTGTAVTDPVPGYIKDILRDLGFLALAAFIAWRPFSRLSLDARLGMFPNGVTP
ncbi:MAG: DoxX family membrane protein [Kineosporiaceae bacterium]|nr:DoxX family membrane protein [Kineosporiaceae bacterium]